ncbi:DUF927 domain-containing protein [Streptomyces sp. SLBN-134]|uniref:DUF927 domain-containing protein n=1 Tax=Streptomyces sp. SLBN-134 TaxID=2768456 RepID=UPI001154DFE3|nr:DUF927 domain-containing protein [Streptomyces sp. SLBN-134]TQL14682.1 uncharacterized protein DUF927 [Streptomyces sp. SLBN-134]
MTETLTTMTRSRETEGAARIPGAKISKTEWWFRPSDRMVLQVAFIGSGDERIPVGEPVGTVPPVTGWVTKKDEDGQDTTIEYRLKGKSGRCVVVSEDDLDRGTWAGKVGQERPSGNDAKLAFSLVIRQEARDRAPEVTAVPYMDGGAMFFPEADTQNIGYRQLAGAEDDARKAWRTILGHAMADPKTLLALGSFMAGPLVAPFGLVAHIVNHTGPGQQGKSTTQEVQAGMFGRIEEGILRSWNSSAQGIPQILRRARFLPLALEENSAKGDGVAKTEQMMSSMVGGANRAMGSADGNGGTSLGRWRSVLSSSSNLSLRRPGQSEDLASRLYELPAPFWPNVYVDRDGRTVPEGTARCMHLSKWVKRAAANFHGWPLEWAIRDGWFTAEGLAKLQDAHDAVTQRIAPKGGGIAGTVGEVHALWVVGAHLLGASVGIDGCGDVAEAEAVRQLPAALISSEAAALTPAEQLWEAITAAMAQGHRFPEVDLTAGDPAGTLRARMEERGNDVHGFVSVNDDRLWFIPGKLREVAERAHLADTLHAGLAGMKESGVLLPGDPNRLPAKPPRALRGTIKGLGTRLYRFDLAAAGREYGGQGDDPEGGPDNGPQGGPRKCNGYNFGKPCDVPLHPDGDDGNGRHANCVPAPAPRNEWPAGTIGAEVAALPFPEDDPEPEAALPAPRPEAPAPAPAPAVRQPVDVPAPSGDVRPSRPGRKAPALAVPDGPHSEFLAAAVARKSVTNERQLGALAERLALLDDPEIGEAPARLRLLFAMEGNREAPGPFAPFLRRTSPRWQPERPAVIDAVRVMDGWSWEREDYDGEVVVMDRNGSWPTAVSSVRVVHGEFEHTGAVEDLTGQAPAPGYYKVRVYPWTETDLPSPLGSETVGEERWITGTRMHLLADLAAAGRWPDASASDSWTGTAVRLSSWAHLIGECRRYALETHGRESGAYDAVKEAFGQSMGLMYGSLDGDGASMRRKWNCRSRRTDWVHAIKDQASATIWRTADKVRQLGDGMAPVSLRNVDELVLPAAALAAATEGDRPALRLDDSGTQFGTWKVKGTESWGDE